MTLEKVDSMIEELHTDMTNGATQIEDLKGQLEMLQELMITKSLHMEDLLVARNKLAQVQTTLESFDSFKKDEVPTQAPKSSGF